MKYTVFGMPRFLTEHIGLKSTSMLQSKPRSCPSSSGREARSDRSFNFIDLMYIELWELILLPIVKQFLQHFTLLGDSARWHVLLLWIRLEL